MNMGRRKSYFREVRDPGLNKIKIKKKIIIDKEKL
jgi:hypothetical protein